MSSIIKAGRFSLRITIGTFISFLLVLIGCLVLAVYWHDSRRTLLEFSDELAGQVAATTREQVSGFLGGPEAAVGQIRRMALNGAFSPDDLDDLEAGFFSVLQSQPRIAMAGWGDAAGNFTMAKRRPDGSIATKIIRRFGDGTMKTVWRERRPGAPRTNYTEREEPTDRYDPRKRPWYTSWVDAPVSPGRVHWTDVYVFHADKLPGVTASLPLSGPDGRLRGVFAVDVALADLCDFLSDIRIGDNGQAMILDTGGRLVATRRVEDLVEMHTDDQGELVPVLRILQNSPDPVVAALALSTDYRGARDGSFASSSRFVYQHEGRRHLATLVPVEAGSRRWVIGVTVPENDFLGGIKRNMIVAGATVATLIILAILVGLKFTNILAQSLKSLVTESQNIRNLDFRDTPQLRSSFKEIHEVLTSFQRMKTGVRAFGRFVPKKLVNQMLKKNIEPSLGGEVREITVMFSDIRGFTTITEEMGDHLPIKLGGYFSNIASIIEEQFDGTVDKTVGDSIIAMWNAPEDVDNHALKACRAILRCIEAIEKHQEDWPDTTPFFTCFGLHTGSATVGHFGYQERLDYTCIGDTVNLAARLEQINKYYGTQVIVSEATWDCVKEHFEGRRLDLVAVKGKTRGVFLYELLGEKGQVDPGRVERARRYNEAFSLYLDRRFSEAVALFQDLLANDPHDAAVNNLLRRCEMYVRSAPSADWEGVYVMEDK